MINQLIASYLRDALFPLTGGNGAISRLAGLVKVLETDRFSKDKKPRRFPISLETSPSNCASHGRSFPDLVPDAKERLIVYFEDQNSASSDGGKKWIAKLRLVAWGNSEGFLGVPPPMVATLLTGVFRKQFSAIRVPPESPISCLSVSIIGSPVAGTNLFSAYTYSEIVSQYLLPPYFSFGLDLSITFVLNDTCNFDLAGNSVGGNC